MRFHWDDQEEAYYRGTKHHNQNGMIKTWKLDHETDEEYQERTRKMMYDKIGFLFSDRVGWGPRGVDSIKFR